MTDLLVKLFLKNADDVKNPAVREKYGLLSGVVGIVLNLLLSAGKLLAGVATPLKNVRKFSRGTAADIMPKTI